MGKQVQVHCSTWASQFSTKTQKSHPCLPNRMFQRRCAFFSAIPRWVVDEIFCLFMLNLSRVAKGQDDKFCQEVWCLSRPSAEKPDMFNILCSKQLGKSRLNLLSSALNIKGIGICVVYHADPCCKVISMDNGNDDGCWCGWVWEWWCWW